MTLRVGDGAPFAHATINKRTPNPSSCLDNGSGNASIDVDAASEHGIAVVHTG